MGQRPRDGVTLWGGRCQQVAEGTTGKGHERWGSAGNHEVLFLCERVGGVQIREKELFQNVFQRKT